MTKDDLLSIDFMDYYFKQTVFHAQFVNKIIISAIVFLLISRPSKSPVCLYSSGKVFKSN